MATALTASYQALLCLCGPEEQRQRLDAALRHLSKTLGHDQSQVFAGSGVREKWISSKAREKWRYCRDRLQMGNDSDAEQIGAYLDMLYSRQDKDAAIRELVEDIVGIFEHLVREGFN